MNTSPTHSGHATDRGTILPLVLIVVVVLGAVIAALATYSSTTLRYGQVVERSADRLATTSGAIDNVLESIDRQSSLCTMSALPAMPGGYTFALGDNVEINGIAPTLNCEVSGGSVSGVEAWALVLTGGGTSNDALLHIYNQANNSDKVVTGAIYMAEPPVDGDTIEVNADFVLENGDLWYSAPTCPDPSVTLPGNMTITPAGYGVRCVEHDFATIFAGAQPSVPPGLAAMTPRSSTPPADTDGDNCYVWEPGAYSSPPQEVSGSYNYFRSGDYYFNFPDVGPHNGAWYINQAWVLFGAPDGAPGIPGYQNSHTLATNPCQDDWAADPDQGGATLYLDSHSHISLENNSALEVAGRAQTLSDDRVIAVQTLSTTTITADHPRLIRTSPGNNRQVSINGLLWAPSSSVQFDNITNDAVAALTGGAVVAELHLGATASATNFLIRSGSAPTPSLLTLTATAVSAAGGTTEVEAVIEYRDGDYGLISRRVRCLTPGDC